VTPINATFCPTPAKSVSLAVNSVLTTFDWYAASTGGSVLTGGSGTNTYTTPAISATTTYYVQDTRTYTYTNASTYLYTGGTGLTSVNASVSATHTSSMMAFTVQKTLTLVSVDVFKTVTCTAPGTVAGKIALVGSTTQVINFTLNCGSVTTVPINLTLAPGDYILRWDQTMGDIRYFQNAVYPTGVTGLISFTDASTDYGVWTSSFFNVNITAQFNCGRIPVQAIASTCTTPVNFLSFEAEKINGNAHLNWNTIEHGENDLFEIERSADGIMFDVVGKVDAKSGQNSFYSYVDYSYTDKSTPASIMYYRIKQYDKDGKFIYSEIRAITDRLVHEIEISPNPSENNFNLSVSDLIDCEFKGEIFSNIGVKVETINGTTNNNLHFGDNLPSGVYLLKLMIANDTPVILKICKR
jgi:hypothetical protein